MSGRTSNHSKALRQQSLRRILSESKIVSQEEVVDRMLSDGFQVTQSSISRDFRELGVIKVGGRYMVSTPGLVVQLGNFVVSSAKAGDHLFVVKAVSGWTAAISEAIDAAGLAGVVGTIAGENTIMVATEDSHAHERIKEFLSTL